MVRSVFSDGKGLVQKAGAGTVISNHSVLSVNAAKNLTADDCGFVNLGVVGTQQAVGTGFNVNLPAPARGLYFKFMLAAPSIASNANAAITIKSTSDGTTAANLMVGQVNTDGAPTNVVAAVDVITFVHNKATAGDQAECYSDGTNWFVTIHADADGAVTLA